DHPAATWHWRNAMKSNPALYWRSCNERSVFSLVGRATSPAVHAAIMLLAIGALLLAALRPCAAAEPAGFNTLQDKQQSQQRARTLARELVAGVLDVQLQKLEENGLTERQIYPDIRSMQQNIDGLIEAEMRQVVELLRQAQTADVV